MVWVGAAWSRRADVAAFRMMTLFAPATFRFPGRFRPFGAHIVDCARAEGRPAHAHIFAAVPEPEAHALSIHISVTNGMFPHRQLALTALEVSAPIPEVAEAKFSATPGFRESACTGHNPR